MVVQVDCDEIELQKISYESFQWRHHQYVTEKRHQNNVTKSEISQSNFFGYASKFIHDMLMLFMRNCVMF